MMDFESGREIEADTDALDGAAAALAQEQGLTAQDAAAQELPAAAQRVLTPNEQNIVILPPGASLEDLQVDGRDLVIVLADGTRMVIPEGAIVVPQLVVEGVAVPPANLAALLTGNEPQPAAGPPESSGGNFSVDPGAIQAAYGLGDLLPYTALQFPEAPEREIIPDLVDQDPEVVIVTPDNPAGAVNATDSVSETGLPTRNNGEPQGTAAPTNAEVTTGSIVYTSPDGFASLAINGVVVTQVGQTIDGDFGTLTVTSIAPGAVGYSYTLDDNLLGGGVDGFAVTVTDIDGDTASATLDVQILDDAPLGEDDADSVPAGTYGPATGNVSTGQGTNGGAAGADTVGADNAVLTAISNGSTSLDVTGATTISGTYGVLVINADGSYSYARNSATPGGVTDAFTYTLTDSDGSETTAILTIDIGDAPATVISVPETGAGTIVDEDGLPPRTGEAPGTNSGTDSETTAGIITFTAPDGPATVAINGVTITGPGQTIEVPEGTLTITTFDPVAGTLGYSFTLGDNTGGDETSATFTVTVTDLDGDSDTEDFVITIVDDAPLAADDSATQSPENASVTIDVFTNDIEGADSVAPDAIAAVAGTLTGAGALAYNGDGTFTYTPAPGEEGIVTFDYTITDGDGDVSTATVTITLLDDSTPAIAVAGDNSVDEAALPARPGEPAGSNAPSDGETAAGAISVTTGNDSIASLVVNGVDVTGGGTVTTASGVLTVTFANGAYSYSYTLADNTLADPDSDVFTLTVTDSDGDPASTTLTIDIVDDAPSALDDANAIAAGTYGPAIGNVLTNDTQGADAASVTGYTGAGGSGAAGVEIQGQYGTLTIAADGSYSYTRDAGTPGGVSDSFTYTITDGDGDTAQAQLVIAIANSPTTLDVPVTGEAGTQVLEEGLAGPPAGSNAAGNGEFTSGTITFTAPDGPASVTIGGVTVDSAGDTVTGAFGTLTVTAIGAGSISYSYELTANTNGDATSDSFTVVVTDQDGDSSTSDLIVDIVDDVPTAQPDTDSVAEDGPLTAEGNVITDVEGNGDGGGDTTGADGASVVGVSFATNNGVVGSPLPGEYGSLTLNADGSYSYALDNANAFVQGLDSTETLTEVFSYILRDGDVDSSVTTLTITIQGSDDGVTVNGLDGAGAEEVLDEADLADGSSPTPAALTQSGSFTVDSPDGLTTLTVGGVTVFDAGATTTYPVTIDDPVYGLLEVTGVTTTLDGDGDVVSATIAYSYVLDDNSLLHTGGNDGSFTDSFTVVATDSDGSTDTASLDITVVDDVPTANDDAAGQATENQSVTIDALGNDEFGADGVDTADAADVFVSTQAGQGVVTYDPATGLFTYTPNAGAGSNGDTTDSFEYTIVDRDGDVSTATVTVTLQPDSEPSGGTVNASVDDDGLAGNPNSTTGDLDANAGDDPADTSEASFTGTLAFDVGNDTPASISFDPALDGATAQVGLEMVTYSVTGNLLTASGPRGVLFTVEITDTATGAYTVTLADNVLHDGGPNDEAIDALASIGFIVADSEGETVSTTLDIAFDDDAPSAFDNGNSVTEGGEVGGNVLSDGADDIAGADGFAESGAVLSIASTNQGTSDATANGAGNFVLAGQYGTLTLNQNGTYSYQSDPNATNVDAADVFTYTVVDADGDTATATLTIDVQNVAGNVFDNDATVDEAGLDTAQGTGSDPASDSEIDANGQITVSGAVGPFTYVLTSPADGTFGTLTLDATTGAYTYVLDTPFTDADTLENTTNVVNGAEGFTYEVYDSANNLIGGGTISVNIVDDIPTATDQTLISVAEDALAAIGGNVMTDGTDDTEGADGATVTAISIGGATTAVPQDGSDAVVVTANGTYTIDMDGNWSFDPVPGLDQTGGPIDASFTYTLTDGDDDFDTGTQPIRIDDGAAPNDPAGIDLSVDDQNLADGSTPAPPETDSDTINFVPGSDPFASIVFGDTTGLGGNLTWTRVDDFTITGTDGGRPVITLTLSVTGDDATVTATLDDNYLGHGDPGDELDDLGSVNVVATDTDGDVATGMVDVAVSDDVPSVSANLAVLLDDDALGGNSGGTDDDADSANTAGTVGFDFNADGAGSIAFLTSGAPAGFQYVASGNDILIQQDQGGVMVTVLTVTLDATSGAYTVTQNDTILHDNADDENNEGFTLTYVVTDGDNDTAQGSLTIDVDDDTPVITNVALDSSVDLDETDAVSPAGFPITGTSADPIIEVTGNHGADGEAGTGGTTYAITVVGGGTTMLQTADGDFPITLVQTNATTITGTFDDGGGTRPAFTLVINSDGTVTLTQEVPLEHTTDGGPGSAHNDTLTLAGLVSASVTLLDADGDSVTQSAPIGNAVTFFDDGPLAQDDTNSLTEDTASVGGNILTDGTNDDFGADGAGSPQITAIVGTAAGTVGGNTTGSWGTLQLAADGTYTYTLNTALVQNLDDTESVTDTFTYTIIDSDGDTDTATLVITINGDNDAPVAADDTNWVLDVTTGADPTTMGNVLLDLDHPGAPTGDFADVADTDIDAEPLTVTAVTGGTVGVSLAGTYGAIVINGDGTYTYTLDSDNAAVDALDDGEMLTDSFTYTVSDGTTTDTATVTITIFGTNDAPVLTPSSAAVSEEGLLAPAGNPDDDPVSPADADTTDSRTANGSIGIADPDGDTFTVTLGSPSATLTSGGETIVWTVSNGGLLLTGATTAGTVVTVSIDATGAYSVSLERQIDHTDTTTEDTTSFVIPVSVSDGTAPAEMTNITVTVEDDSPILGALSPDSATVDNIANATATGTFPYSPGGDGHGEFAITYTGDPITGVTYSTTQIDSDLDGVNDGAILTATAGADTLYTLEVDTDGEYTFTLVTPDAETQETLSFSTLAAGGPGFRELDDDPATLPNENGRVEFTSNGTGVNANANDFGVSNSFVDPGEFFTMEFHNPGTDGDDAAGTDPEFLSSIDIIVNDLRDSPGNVGPNVTLQWTATNTVTGEVETGTVTVTTEGAVNIDPTITFNQMKIENVDTAAGNDGGRIAIGGVTIFKTILPQDQALDFDISATDLDGDPSGTSSLSVLIDASMAAPLDAKSMAMYSLDMALAHDAGSNDNGGGDGPALFGARFGAGPAAMRADMRTAEMTAVAAAATGFILPRGDFAPESTPFAAETAGFDPIDTAASSARAMVAEGADPARGFELDGRLGSVDGGRAQADLSSVLDSEPAADFVHGLSAADLAETGRPEPLFDFGGAAENIAQEAATPGLADAMGAGAAMEALLLMDANAPVAHPDAQGALASIEDAIGDIAAEQAVERLAEYFGEGGHEGASGEVSPLLEGGALDQMLHGGGPAFDLAAVTLDQLDEAALAAAATAHS